MSQKTQQSGASSPNEDDGQRTPRGEYGHGQDAVRRTVPPYLPSGLQPQHSSVSSSHLPLVDTSSASQTTENYTEASYASSNSSPDRGTPFDNILNPSPRSSNRNTAASLRRRKSIAQPSAQPRGISKSTRRQSSVTSLDCYATDAGEGPSELSRSIGGYPKRRPPSLSVSGPPTSRSHTPRLSLSNIMSNDPHPLPPLSRVSSPFRPDDRSPSGLTTPTLGPPPGPLPPQPPPQVPPPSVQNFPQHSGHASGYSFTPAPSAPTAMFPVTTSPYTPGLSATDSHHSPSGTVSKTTPMYDMLEKFIKTGAPDSGSRSSASGPPMLAFETAQGTIVEVPLDSTSGSKNSDQKRRNNADASRRFRQRKKDTTLMQTQRLNELERLNKQQEEQIAAQRNELDQLRRELEQERRARQEAQQMLKVAQDHGFQMPAVMTPLPPISALSTGRDIAPRGSVTPAASLMEQRTDYFGAGALDSLPPTAASTPGLRLEHRDDYFGTLEPNVSRPPSVGLSPVAPAPRISPPVTHRRANIPPLLHPPGPSIR